MSYDQMFIMIVMFCSFTMMVGALVYHLLLPPILLDAILPQRLLAETTAEERLYITQKISDRMSLYLVFAIISGVIFALSIKPYRKIIGSRTEKK